MQIATEEDVGSVSLVVEHGSGKSQWQIVFVNGKTSIVIIGVEIGVAEI